MGFRALYKGLKGFGALGLWGGLKLQVFAGSRAVFRANYRGLRVEGAGKVGGRWGIATLMFSWCCGQTVVGLGGC